MTYEQAVIEVYLALQRGEVDRDEALDRFVVLAREHYRAVLDELAER